MPILAPSLRASRLRIALAVALCAAAAALAAAALAPAGAQAMGYPGMRLNPPGQRLDFSYSGPVFVRIYCPGQVFGYPQGYCTGRMTLLLKGRRIATAPVSAGDYDGPSKDVRLPGWFRRLAERRGPQSVRVVMRTHDLQGLWRTTRGHITISAPGHGRARGVAAPPLPQGRASRAPRERDIPSPGSFPDAPRFVGSWGNPRGVDGSHLPGLFGDGRQAVGGNRQFDNPGAVTVDAAGNVWAADTSNNRIQEFTGGGRLIRAFGSFGWDPGASRPMRSMLSRFDNPRGIVVSGSRAYILDARNGRVMAWNVSGSPRPLWRIGRGGSWPGRFTHPAAIALTPGGRQLLVVDQGNFRVQRFSPRGRYLGSFGHFGTRRGGFQLAWAIATAPDGRIYVLDQMRNRVLVFSSGGRFLTEFGRAGVHRGELNRPQGIAIDPQGRVLIANTGDRRVDRYSLAGQFLDSFGYGGYTDPSRGVMDRPAAVAVNPANGLIYVADAGNVHPSGACGRFRQPHPDPCRPRRIAVYAP